VPLSDRMVTRFPVMERGAGSIPVEVLSR